MAKDILLSLKNRLLKEDLHLNLVAGTRNDVYLYFQEKIKECGLDKLLDKNIKIIFALEKKIISISSTSVCEPPICSGLNPANWYLYGFGHTASHCPSLGAQRSLQSYLVKKLSAPAFLRTIPSMFTNGCLIG